MTAPTVPTPPAAPNPNLRAKLEADVMRERLFVKATEFVMCPGPFGAKGIMLVQQFVYGKPAGWLVRYERESRNVPARVINWDGMIVWDSFDDDSREEHFTNTRFSLEDAVTLCDSLDLWSCRWVQGQGYVNAAGTWVGQNNYVDLRVPEHDEPEQDPRLGGIMEECYSVSARIDEDEFQPGDGERLRNMLTEWDESGE